MCKIVLSVQHLELFAVVFELSLVAVIQASGLALEEVLCREGLGKEPSSHECPNQIGTVGNYVAACSVGHTNYQWRWGEV